MDPVEESTIMMENPDETMGQGGQPPSKKKRIPVMSLISMTFEKY